MELDREALLQSFLGEAEEQLTAMEQGVIALERRPDDRAALEEVYRAAHTLKGNASCLGFESLTRLAHLLEEVLARLTDRRLVWNTALVTLILDAFDGCRELIPLAAAGTDEIPPGRLALFRALERWGGAPGGETGAAVTAATPAPIADVGSLGASHRTLRVDVTRLDRLLDLVGELAVARGRLTQVLRTDPGRGHEVQIESDLLYQDLQEQVLQLRMVQVGPTFQRYRRAVRDLALTTGKQALLVLEGEDVEVDMAVVEVLRDPLTHLIRNAVDHGIESPEVRRARGKDPVGQITLRAFHERGNVVIQLSDDGAGMDRTRIVEKAVELGLVSAAQVAAGEVVDADALIFAAGLSTAERITDLSGRGIGMDVVRRNVETLRGSVELVNTPGHGVTVTIRLPLTIAIVQGFAIGVADETYIVPLESVVECVDLAPENAIDGESGGVINLRGEPLPYLRLGHQFGSPRAMKPGRENVVVIEHDGRRAGIAVDALLGEAQTVVKPLGRMFEGVNGVAGSAILGNGRVALLLDVRGLLRTAMAR